MAVCGKCGERVTGSPRCRTCGAQMPLQSPCPSCGKSVPWYAKVCFGCGTSLVAGTPGRSPKVIAVRDPFPRHDHDGEWSLERLVKEGNRFYAEKRFAEALGRFERAITARAGHPPAWLGKGAAMLGLGEVDEGLRSLVKAVELDPKNQGMLALVTRLVGTEAPGPPADLETPPMPPEASERTARWHELFATLRDGLEPWRLSPFATAARAPPEVAKARTGAAEGRWSFDDGAPPAARLLEMADVEAKSGRFALALERLGPVLADDVDAPGAAERDARYRPRQTLATLARAVLSGKAGEEERTELRRIAVASEGTDPAVAAQAFARAGDEMGRIRVLSAGDPYVALRAELADLDAPRRRTAPLSQALREALGLVRAGRRREALEATRASADPSLIELGSLLLALFARGPLIDLEIAGERTRYSLGATATLGRAGSIPIPAHELSRQHAKLFRRGGEAFFEDLGTARGTTLAGARLGAPLAIGRGLRVELAGSIPCSIQPLDVPGEPVIVEVAGQRTVTPLGPLFLAGLRLDLSSADDAILATADDGAQLLLDGTAAQRSAELLFGDMIESSRDGGCSIRVLPPKTTAAPPNEGDERLEWVAQR